jgi:hypothetical protein
MYAVLAGGVGAARFLRGLARVVPADEIVAIVNVGDDLTRFGLRICPDLDSITYWLGGVVHPGQQWGRADESHVVAGELARFGHDAWFTLGDRDLGVHLHRSARLADGVPLSVVTDEVRRAFDVDVRLLPATDDPVETRITTRDGRDLHFQEYWVRERGAPRSPAVTLAGAERATRRSGGGRGHHRRRCGARRAVEPGRVHRHHPGRPRRPRGRAPDPRPRRRRVPRHRRLGGPRDGAPAAARGRRRGVRARRRDALRRPPRRGRAARRLGPRPARRRPARRGAALGLAPAPRTR